MADRICDNCMGKVPVGTDRCPKCGIRFENTNPGGALPNGWVLGNRYTIGRYNDIDGEGVTYSAIDGNTLQRVVIKEFMPVTLCATRDETGAIRPKPGNEVLFKTTRIDFAELYGILLRMGLAEGLVQVLDVLEENNTAYAVLEKIEGPSLAEYLTKREGAIDAPRALALMRPILNGVEAMHSANLVHRGISPDNIILESGGTARLCGYGTLALRQQGSELKPKLYPGYSAPEQYAASEFEGRYTDVYALGGVLYRLTTGEPPAPTNERRMQDALRPARTINKEVPAFLSAGIARAMRLLAAERIQNIPDLRLALAGEGGGTSGKPKGKSVLGLTRQQLIVGAAALGAVVVLLLVILLISAFTRNRTATSSSHSISVSSSSSASTGETIPDFTGRKYDEVIASAYADTFDFAEPEYEPSNDVEEGRIIRQSLAAGTLWDNVTPIRLVVSEGRASVTMPELTGMQQDSAVAQLKQLGLQEGDYTIVKQANNGEAEVGTVMKTEPPQGQTVKPGTDSVVLHVAGEVTTIVMPDVVGRPQGEATAELDRQSIQYTPETITNTAGYQKVGMVESTNPPAGSSIATGSTVVTVKVYGKFYLPNLDSYKGGNYKDLQSYLDKFGVPYRSEKVDNPSNQKQDTVSDIQYVANSEVTGSTEVVIEYFGEPSRPSSSGGPSSENDSGSRVDGV